MHWSKEFLVKANGTQEVIESFPCLHHLKSQYLLLFSLFVTFHFQGKSDGPNLTGSTIGFFPRDILCVWGGGEGRGSCLLPGLPQVFSDLGRSQTYRHQQSQRAYCPHWAEVCQGRGMRIWCLGQCMFVKHLQGCVCHTRASNFGFFTTKPTGAY